MPLCLHARKQIIEAFENEKANAHEQNV